MNKPKYIIYDNFQEEYFLGFMLGYTADINKAYRYSEEDILNIFKEIDGQWLFNCRVKQVYEEI